MATPRTTDSCLFRGCFIVSTSKYCSGRVARLYLFGDGISTRPYKLSRLLPVANDLTTSKYRDPLPFADWPVEHVYENSPLVREHAASLRRSLVCVGIGRS